MAGAAPHRSSRQSEPVMPVELEPSPQIVVKALVHSALPESDALASEPAKALPAATTVSPDGGCECKPRPEKRTWAPA